MEFLEFVFRSFWHFIGFVFMVSIPIQGIINIIVSSMRFNTLNKIGWPPEHLDANGNFKQVQQKDN